MEAKNRISKKRSPRFERLKKTLQRNVKLRLVCLETDLTACAEARGLTPNNVYRWLLNGNPTMEKLDQLALILHCKASNLIDPGWDGRVEGEEL